MGTNTSLAPDTKVECGPAISDDMQVIILSVLLAQEWVIWRLLKCENYRSFCDVARKFDRSRV